ncbi:MAG TPA: hypothetical protein VGP25_09750 [Gemmatimonadaceae bacterium]|nr:hypothetical protein [Gemmatimonadaceae bacterium]
MTIAGKHRRVARTAIVLSLSVGVACASGGRVTPAPGPSPAAGPTTQSGPPPLVQTTWPVRTREHVDLWLHSYALLTSDSNLVPYFARGYRDRVIALRRQRNVTSQLDANRARLLSRIDLQPSLATGPQFIPFYFESWDQMRQAVDLFSRANGNPRATNDPTLQTYISILAASFPTSADREWLRLFVASVDDESRRFHHEYWAAETRARVGVIARVDSLWQRQWRPPLQRFLNNTQQQNGELYLTLPLGGEGRTVHFGKLQNAVGVGMPASRDDTDQVLYTFAHEIAGSVASTAIEDNTTPAERRAGATARFEQSAAVRAGALLLERTIPAAVPGYMRFYLQAAGRTAPTDPRAAFATTFTVPEAVTTAIARQLEVILGGI